MKNLKLLNEEVKVARKDYLNILSSFTLEQGMFKPEDTVWSVSEITEHLYHAEIGGIAGMWKALVGKKFGNPPWKKEHSNKGLSIEDVIKNSWKTKEQVPEGAGPRFGGPLFLWIDALNSCQQLLDRLADELEEEQLDTIIYPHPISGPLDVHQRFEFLRFHINRHKVQVENLMQHQNFPKK